MSKRAAKIKTAVVVDDPDLEFTCADEGPVFFTKGKMKIHMIEKSGIRPAKLINDTGIEPVEYKCVVRLDPVEEKTSGGIIIPDDRKDRNQMSATRATLLACGGNAFEDWKGCKPVAGDRVEVSKYAGITREADPTDLVRIIQDKEILGVLT